MHKKKQKMDHTIEKSELLRNVKEPIYATVAHSLIRQIRGGKMHPGDQVPSERELAERWGISRGTARLALKELETFGYVERQGARGTIIRYDGDPKRPLRVVFAFPEKSISPDILSPECWAISSELHRGMLAGAAETGVQVFFEHFADNVTPEELRSQLKRLHNYDAAVFTGWQLDKLQNEFAQDHPVFQVCTSQELPSNPRILPVYYQSSSALEKLSLHAKECGCKTVGVLSFYPAEPPMTARAGQFLQISDGNGLQTTENFYFKVNLEADIGIQLDRILKGPLPEFLFLNHTEQTIAFYEAAFRNGIRIGKDVKVAGIATGLTFQGLIPSYTYVRVPMFESGKRIIEALAENPELTSVPVLEVPLIPGNSTLPVQIKNISHSHREKRYDLSKTT